MRNIVHRNTVAFNTLYAAAFLAWPYHTIFPPNLPLPLDRWGDDESITNFCDEFSEWETRRCTGGGSGRNNGVALAGETDVEVVAEIALAEGTTLRTASTRTRSEVVDVGQTPTDVARSVVPEEESSGSPQQPDSRPPLRSFDFVLAGDVLYKRCLLDPFLGTVRGMLAPGGRMLLCHVPRAGVTYEIVEQAFVGAGFAFEILNGDNKKESRGGEGEEEEDHQDQECGNGPGLTIVDDAAQWGSRCDTTAVGGVELCVDDARRARLYEVYSVD